MPKGKYDGGAKTQQQGAGKRASKGGMKTASKKAGKGSPSRKLY
jgi:hypothetical protein